ncbi:MarC family protein [Bradyrhizobium sp. BR 10261]|uniref:MarC family protein n=1 Tax=Bradyrhizobium sp. BR 10261 TaxID=2749992 RepID=UPI001C64B83B|nr:MarC family protein [Bradyrhizobium sp. BR 10261]MBW7967406.1 hypothetical protein [Bradyrhizobium sp. BR 10261]
MSSQERNTCRERGRGVRSPTAAIYHAYRKSSAMARVFGEERTSVVTRLSAFLLLRIGVQIIITGTADVARTIPDGAPHTVHERLPVRSSR